MIRKILMHRSTITTTGVQQNYTTEANFQRQQRWKVSTKQKKWTSPSTGHR